MVLHRNPIRSALLLIVNFCALAVFYVLLNAQVLAVMQILVYAGAIMVLFLFVIMLLNLGGEMSPSDPLVGQRMVGAILGIALLTGLMFAINQWAAVKPPVRFGVPAAGDRRPGPGRFADPDHRLGPLHPLRLPLRVDFGPAAGRRMGVIILTKRRAATVNPNASGP